MKLQSLKYILPLLTVSTIAWAGTNESDKKVRSVNPIAPPIAQQYIPTALRSVDTQSDVPQNVRVEGINDTEVSLIWDSPEPTSGFFEDFESHNDFIINSPGAIGWNYIDGDQQATYTLSAVVFPNQGQTMSYIVMNPSQTTPAQENPAMQPHSGNKFLAAFTVDNKNNDWIVSPELNFERDFQFSFYAKTYNDKYGKERIRVGYSTTGMQPSNFTFVSEGEYEEVPTEWTLMKYDIPAEAKYVTINCVSAEAFVLMLDDIFVGENNVRPRAIDTNPLQGFNIYRDGEKLNDEVVESVRYNDTVPSYDTYTYTIKAVYEATGEGIASEPLEIEVPNIRLLPFYDDFETFTFNTQQWELPEGEYSQWSVDYYEYGMINPCATYSYSNINNYSHSLVSKEVHTKTLDNVDLRFDMRIRREKTDYENFLAIEVSCDNRNWVAVDTLSNLDFEPMVHHNMQYNIGKHLTGKEFRIRLRAFGAYAFYIDYWYIDNLKIWNVETTEATLHVAHDGEAVANATVSLKNSDGISVDYTTDNDGDVHFDRIEKETYTVSVKCAGYNEYSAMWQLTETSNNFVANITVPTLTIDREEVTLSLNAEEVKIEPIQIANNGGGTVDWKIAPSYAMGSGTVANRWNKQGGFNASGDLQSSVAFDGEYYFTTSWLFAGLFQKYDRNGNFIKEFLIEDIYTGLRDFAFDGHYFYASNEKNSIYVMDLRNERLIKEFYLDEYPNLEIRHCAYDPRSKNLWLGGYNSICRVDLNGEITFSERDILDESMGQSASIEGSAFDMVSPGGPYLWLACSASDNSTPNNFDQVKIRQYSLRTMSMTSTTKFLGEMEGFTPGDYMSGPVSVMGLVGSTDVTPGSFSLLGTFTQSPSYIYNINICDLPAWLSASPIRGELQAGEEQTLNLTIDAVDGVVGSSYNLALEFITNPSIETSPINVTYTVAEKATYVRPTALAASMANESDVLLTWQCGDGQATPDGYHVYRDGKQLTTTPVTETTYTDTQRLRGTYSYEVKAVYGEQLSIASEAASIFVKVGMPCFPPISLTSAVELNQYVNLAWLSPDETGNVARTLQWGSGRNVESLGLAEGGTFFAGSIWAYEDLIDYRGMKITEAEIFVNDFVDALVLNIYKDNEVIYTQGIPSGDIAYGDYNTVVLDEPITIEMGYEYNIAFRITHQASKLPLGLDEGPSEKNKGNMWSEDGVNWYAATLLGAADANFNIAFRIEPSDEATPAAAPIRKTKASKSMASSSNTMPTPTFASQSASSIKVSPLSEQNEAVTLQGYNVYRNGVQVNSALVTEKSYTDTCSSAGKYTYTVSSVYNVGESVQSDGTKISIIEIGGYYAPHGVSANVQLNKDVTLAWAYPTEGKSVLGNNLPTTVTSPSDAPAFINNWSSHARSEVGIMSDGEYLYTSTWNLDGLLSRYTLEGEFIENISIDGIGGIRNMTYDGEYFYMGDGTSVLYKVDLATRTVLAEYNVSAVVRYVSYIPELENGKGGFIVGDWDASVYVTMEGAKICDGPSFNHAYSAAYYNGNIYAFEQGNANTYTIAIYDVDTFDKVGMIDPDRYDGLPYAIGQSAGGISFFTTPEGIDVMATTFQQTPYSMIALFEMGSMPGVVGYNVYCNDELVNETPITTRMYKEEKTESGTYNYQVETVYIDGEVSEKSSTTTVTIDKATDDCAAPIMVKATPSSYPYNVIVSFVDPLIEENADQFLGAEEEITGDYFTSEEGWTNRNSANNGGWSVVTNISYEGNNSLYSYIEEGESNWLISPEQAYDFDYNFSFVARNLDDHVGFGSIKVLTSTGSNELADFIPAYEVTTTEAWEKYSFTIAKDVKYIALQHSNSYTIQLVDAVSIASADASLIYGYNLYRDGEKLNEQPIASVSYVDRNMMPDSYTYQVEALYEDGCISDLTEELDLVLNYDMPCAAPEHLTANSTSTGVSLAWRAPAIGEQLALGWHSGTSNSSIGLPSGGSFFAGAKWMPADLASTHGLSLSAVEMFIDTPPDMLVVIIYEGQNIKYMQSATELKQQAFNTVKFDTPIELNTEKELRVVLYIEHSEFATTPLGLDEGPSEFGKGDLYSTDGITWTTVYEASEQTSDANWNISAIFAPYRNSEVKAASATDEVAKFELPVVKTNSSDAAIKAVASDKAYVSNQNKFSGYKVYRNGECLTTSPILLTNYFDISAWSGYYNTYMVSSVYDVCQEVYSDQVVVNHTGNIENGVLVPSMAVVEKSLIVDAPAGSVIEVVSATGNVLHKEVLTTPLQTIDMSSYGNTSIYLVRLSLNGKVLTVNKVVIE